ncbi:hypothetical protein C6Y14_00315 [Streptomyces dioscori]|uniref:Uncharacterized protein n=1 Tax=Streptomyces dioscori TaxID=2109333 RepID=A0A2P8QEE4_9ACTN|nr:hypothetical protein C6Y14_00315 [Streptomyces dioscori]
MAHAAVTDDIRVNEVVTTGVFTVTAVFSCPAGMPNYNNEGFSLAGSGECVAGSKPVHWADDTNDGGHALRRGTITCWPLERCVAFRMRRAGRPAPPVSAGGRHAGSRRKMLPLLASTYSSLSPP